MARIWPVVYALSAGSMMERLGRLPVNVLCGMSESGQFSLRSCTAVLPTARASACAKKLHISSSWFDTISPLRYTLCCDLMMPMKSQGIVRPWWMSW